MASALKGAVEVMKIHDYDCDVKNSILDICENFTL